MASEMLSKVLDAENSDKEAQKAAHEQAQKTVDAAVEAGEGAVARKKAEAAKKAEEIIAGAREQARANEEKAEKAAGERKREVSESEAVVTTHIMPNVDDQISRSVFKHNGLEKY